MYHFLHRPCPIDFYLMLKTNGGQAIGRHRDAERCPFSDCNNFHEKHEAVKKHIRTHNDDKLNANIG
jgi:hypothetical protein